MPLDQADTLDPTPAPDMLDTASAGPQAIRGSLVRTGGYVVGTLLSLVSVPLLIRHLGFVQYGRYVTVISLVTIVQGITEVGLGQIGVREFVTRPPAQRERLMRNLLGIRFCFTSIGIAFAVGFAAVANYGAALVLGTLLAGLGMVLSVIQGTFAVPLAAELRLTAVTALEFMRQVLTVVGIVTLVLIGAKLIAFLAITIPVSILVLAATIKLVFRLMPMRPSFDRVEWSTLMRAVLPFAAAVVIGTIYLRITVVLTSLLAHKAQTGYFATSYTVISVLIAIPALTVGTTLPVLARAARDDHERLHYVLQRLIETTLILGVWIGLTLAVGAGFVMEVLAHSKAAAPAEVLEIQSFGVLTQFVATAWQYGLLSLRRHRELLIISAVSLVASVALTLILVPSLQARGAAIAFSGGELVLASLSLVFLKRAQPGLRIAMRVPIRVAAAAGLASLILLVPDLTSLGRALIVATIYLGIVAALRAIPTELLQAVLRKPRLAKG